jgi:hypothetical protein
MWESAREFQIYLSKVIEWPIHNIAAFIIVTALRISGLSVRTEINVGSHLRTISV